jgi:hypothetical protein
MRRSGRAALPSCSGMAMVTASASGAEVSFRPSEISGTEVTVVPDATETELTEWSTNRGVATI